jgi:copper transport protein
MGNPAAVGVSASRRARRRLAFTRPARRRSRGIGLITATLLLASIALLPATACAHTLPAARRPVTAARAKPASALLLLEAGDAGTDRVISAVTADPRRRTGSIAGRRAGSATKVAAGVVRGLDYLSIALVAGTLFFLLWIVPPGLMGGAFERRGWTMLAAGLGLGVVVGVLGVILQGAQSDGLSLGASLRWSVVSGVLSTRFGWVWGVRTALFAISLATLGGRHRRGVRAWLAVVSAFAVATPALSGRPSTQSPVVIFLPADVVHVAAASVWVGGIVCIVFALPHALRAAAPQERTGLLLTVLGRFSPVALVCVLVLALSGIVQGYIAIRSLHALAHTTYGELVLLKTMLLGLLIGMGAVVRERVIPTLRGLAAAGAPPGEAALVLRRATAAEIAAMASVFAVTAALIAFVPPVDAASRRSSRSVAAVAPAAGRGLRRTGPDSVPAWTGGGEGSRPPRAGMVAPPWPPP